MTDNISVHALRVNQRPQFLIDTDEFLNEYDFFVFSLPASKLLRIAKFLSRIESPLGIQRIHKEDRDKEIGQFITSDHPFFPNTIIINIPFDYKSEYYDQRQKILNISVEQKSAYIIDGQHRLKAFSSKFSKGSDLNLVITAYFGLEPPTMAEIFTRINYFQKPVSKSLVYDLLDLNRDPEFLKYKDAHDIVAILNEDITSPFYGLIKMLGIGSGLISQAAFVESLTSRYRILELLNTYSKEEVISILNSYFSAIKANFFSHWGNPNSILTRSVGFNALIKILRQILIQNINNISYLDFEKYSYSMKKVNLDSQEVRTYGGFKGVNALAGKFAEELVKDDLL